MTNPTIEATIEYKENCDYLSSSTTCSIPLSKQNANMQVTIKPIDYDKRPEGKTAETDYYYNDILRITIHIDDGNNVPNGAVSVYYSNINTESPSTEQLINKTPILIDNQGYAYVLYQPHDNGYIIVKYHSSNTYNDMTVIEPVRLQRIPTTLTFQTPVPSFVHLEDAIPLTVYVEDIYGNPLNYGMVTFLSYQIADATSEETESTLSGQERVIGNPVMVQNGYATTTYSPIQVREENILPKGTEFIRAIFNWHESNLYGPSSKYYESHSSWTNIPLLYPSNLTIDAVMLEDNHLEKITMSNNDIIMSDGFIHIKSNQHLMLKFTFTNSNNERITLNNNLKVHFNIKGTEDKIIIDDPTVDTNTYVNEYHQYIEYDRVYEATYYAHQYGEDNIFLSDIGNIPPGYYTIQAYITEGGHTISKGQLKDIHGNIIDIEDMYYYEAAESDKLYLAVDVGEQSYSISIDNNSVQGIYTVNTIAKNKNNPITATINIDSSYYTLLHNQPCIFYIRQLNQQYQGIIKIQNNQLKAILQDEIIFPYANDFEVYVYIKGRYYEYNGDQILFGDVYSNTQTISARFNLIPTIDITYNSEVYAGDVDVNINVDNIFNETIDMRMELVKNNTTQLTRTFSLSELQNNYTTNINNLSAGEYTIKTKIVGHEYVSKNFTIRKNNITAYNDTIRTVPTGNVQLIKIFLNTTNDITTNINVNKLHVWLKYDNNEIMYNIDNENILINNAKDTITFNYPLYYEGEYQIKVQYDGDSNFESLNPIVYPITFNTTTVYGTLNINRNVIISSNEPINENTDDYTLADYIDLSIHYNGTNNQYIIGEIQATNYNNNKIFIPFISDKQGHIHLHNPIDSYEWQLYNNFIINIDPKNSYLINALLNFNDPQEAIEHYFYNNNSKYDNIDIQFGSENNTQTYFNQIKSQLTASGNQTLFTTYKKQTLMETQNES